MEAYDEISAENLCLVDEKSGETRDLKRVLGVKSVVSMSIATMVGSVLVLPGPAVKLTGASAVLAVAASSIIVLAAAFDKSEIATAMPISGGSYVYLAKAFGPLVGTMAGISLWFSLMFKAAFGLAGFSAYLDAMLGEGAVSEWEVKLMGVGLLLVLLAGNLAGLKKIKAYQKMATLLAMFLLFGVCLFSLQHFKPDAFEDHMLENGSTGFIEGIAFVFMGYAGLTKICALASEIKKPEVNMPRSIWWSLGFFTPFFCTVLLACLGNIPFKKLTKDYAPLHTVAVKVGGETFGYVVGAICIVAMASMANIGLMAMARFPFAMARDGLLPPYFQNVSKVDAPYVSLILSAACMGLSILTLPVYRIAKLCSAVKLILFLLVNCSLIIFRVYDEHWYRPTFRSPCFPYLQLSGITFKIIMLVYIGVDGLIAAVGLLVIGVIIYYNYGMHHTQFVGIIRFERWFGLEPEHLEPIKAHSGRLQSHPVCTRDFEKQIKEYEEDHDLPHETHISQIDVGVSVEFSLDPPRKIVRDEEQPLVQNADNTPADKDAGIGQVTAVADP